jgi:hypothetical protein
LRCPAAGTRQGGLRGCAAARGSDIRELVLTFGGMLKTAVLDGAQELGLQQEILEPRGVDPHVALLDLHEARS